MGNLDGPTRFQIPGLMWMYGAANHLVNTADMSSATWNTVATHEVFVVTGAVRMRMIQYCTETLTDAANAAIIQYGVAGTTDAFIAATGAAGSGGTDIETGEFWFDATPTETYEDWSTMLLDKVVGGGLDVGYEITGAALLDGTLEFHCVWEPITAGASVVLGAGGVL